MHQFSEVYFENLGFEVIGVKSKSVSTRNGERVFKSWFGMLPVVCATVWYHLEHTKALDRAPRQSVSPIHLLMGLHFLKNYHTVDKSASDFHCDVKTYLQWSWFFVKAIAQLDSKIVSD